jgi:Replication initiator protein A
MTNIIATDSTRMKKGNPTDQVWKDEMNFCQYPLSVLGDRAPEDVTSLTYEIGVGNSYDREEKRTLSIIPATDEQLQAIVRAACPFLFTDEAAEPTAKRRNRRRETVKREEIPCATPEEVRRAKKRRALLDNVRGVPTANDDDVILALIELTRRKNGLVKDAPRIVQFSLYELIKLLGWNHSSRSYQRLVVSLLRWKAVTLTYVNAWRIKGEKEWLSRTFNIFAEVTIFWGESPKRHPRGVQGVLPFSSIT